MGRRLSAFFSSTMAVSSIRRAAARCSGDISGLALVAAGGGSKTPVATIDAEIAEGHVVDAGHGNLGLRRRDGLQERVGEEVVVVVARADVGTHFQVQAVVGGVDRGVAAAPVGHHQALESPVLLEDLLRRNSFSEQYWPLTRL